MLRSNLIRQQEADLHFEIMAHLVRLFGPPCRPEIPTLLHSSQGLESLTWTDLDSRSAYDWAEDNFGNIKSQCDMDHFHLNLIPAGDGLSARKLAALNRIQSLKSGQIPYHEAEYPPVLYDPRDCGESGHFSATTILQLAEIRMSDFEAKSEVSPLFERIATLTAAAYNRQGFVLANLPRQLSAYLTKETDLRAVPERFAVDNICFATCLALRINHQTEEQIVATYGVRMTPSFRRKVRKACRQINANAEILDLLRILAKPNSDKNAEFLEYGKAVYRQSTC